MEDFPVSQRRRHRGLERRGAMSVGSPASASAPSEASVMPPVPVRPAPVWQVDRRRRLVEELEGALDAGQRPLELMVRVLRLCSRELQIAIAPKIVCMIKEDDHKR